MSLSRRGLLKLGAGAALTCVAGTGPISQAVAVERRRIPIGMQLWPVRHQCQAELPGVLEAAAEMGFDTIEMAHSYYGHDADAWQKLLDDNGLKCCGTLIVLPDMLGDKLKETVEFNQTLCNPYLNVRSLGKSLWSSPEAFNKTVGLFNEI